MPYIGQSLTEGTRREYSYVATAGQTVFPAIYTVGAVDVHQNGILLPPSDYTATDGTTVVFATGCAVDDEVVIHCHNTFSVADTYRKADTYTKTEADAKFVDASGDTVTGNLTIADGTNAMHVEVRNGTNWTGRFAAPAVGKSAIQYFNGSSWANGIEVDSAGRVTMPYQPAAMIRTDISYNASGSDANAVWTFPQVNVGGHYSTSTGRFTAPVAGTYSFSVSLHVVPNYASRASVYLNGSHYIGAAVGSDPSWTQLCFSGFVYMNAGDYLSILISYGSNIHGDPNWGQWNVELLG